MDIKRVFTLIVKSKLAWMLTGLVVCLVVLKLLFGYASDRYACHVKWLDSSIESKYTIRGGCLVNHDGEWIPAEVFRIN